MRAIASSEHAWMTRALQGCINGDTTCGISGDSASGKPCWGGSLCTPDACITSQLAAIIQRDCIFCDAFHGGMCMNSHVAGVQCVNYASAGTGTACWQDIRLRDQAHFQLARVLACCSHRKCEFYAASPAADDGDAHGSGGGGLAGG
jgi:hypothetical protein